MRPDFAAFDAELDALTPAAGFDLLALAESYAGKLGTLPAVDDALSALEVGVPVATQEVSEQIELPEPLRDALLVEEPTGMHTLDDLLTRGETARIEAASARALQIDAEEEQPITARHDVEPVAGGNDFEMRESGAFTVSKSHHPRREDSRDITMEPVDEELLEAEIEEMRPEAAPLANQLFDLNAPANVEAEQEADAAFAALFAEATRQSSMPSVSEQEPADDTEVFHTSELVLDPSVLSAGVPYPAANTDVEVELEGGFHDETLDSAEFEIVNDVVTDGRPANSPSGRPSRPPEKRPSFLGRLFGRKEE
ncbi:MAG TPA: hypothetical protein VFX59_26270 [Polyangiales bacterium]|nr:hypothetical protein [Polyangiales bacterium]